MHGPPALVGWLLVVLGAATGLACLLRPRGDREEALMGIGMAAMAVPASVVDPRPWAPVLFTGVFALATARAVLLARRRGRHGHHAHHAVCGAAMVYMAAAMIPAAPDGMAAHGPGGAPALTGLLLVYFAVYVLAAGVRLVDVPGGVQAVRPAGGAPDVAAACRVSMALGMFAMLLTM
jgi:hypothetical protein